MVAAGQRALTDADVGVGLASIASRYRIEAVLGRGGAGSVYRVLDEVRGVRLALKRLSIKTGTQVGELHRLQFRREFYTLASLTHPKIVRVHDFGFEPEGPYYTMELLEGQDLRDLAPVDAKTACRLLRDVASALGFLHARRLLHRDVGPRNVRTTATGEAKLMDFGLLVTMGSFGEPAGTPPCVAPETLRGQLVDGRADLFGLGALAYWLLTGTHAFPARSLQEVSTLWNTPPPPPSLRASGVSSRLNDLVLSLLSIDPAGRPASAAEVIDRLSAIGGLDELPAEESAVSCIASAALVGREAELGKARRLLDRALDGPGVSFVIEGPSGFGKTRLLRELTLEAKLAGFAVARADGESTREAPYGLLRALARSLLEVAREPALRAAARHAAFLRRVVPELEGLVIGVPSSSIGSKDPREDRIELQERLVRWLLETSGHVPIAFYIDDVQRADEASLSVLAALVHRVSRHRMLIAFGLRSDEAMRAAAPLQAILAASTRIPLTGLDATAIEDLLRNAFGEVRNGRRFARAIHRAVGGSPLFATILFQHLVARGTIRYVAGEWVFPDTLDPAEVPDDLIEAMDQMVSRLSSNARALGQALCLHGEETKLETCVQISDAISETGLFAALEELVREGVLLDDRKTFRFRHDGVREALRRTLDPERARTLHLRIGLRLLEGKVGPDREAEIGWHLLLGGRTRDGADLLARAGQRLFQSRSFFDAVAPLEAALGAYEALGVAQPLCLELRHQLVLLGFFSDRRLSTRYADETLAMFAERSGLTLAERLGPRFGPHLAFVFGFLCATWRWITAWPPARGPSPVQALKNFMTGTAFTMSVASFSFDYAWLERLERRLHPLRIFRNSLLGGARLMSQAMRLFVLGRGAEVMRSVSEVLEMLPRRRVAPTLRDAALGGAKLMRAIVLARDGRPEALVDTQEMGELGLSVWQIGAVQLRVAYHLWRGETELGRRALEEAERTFLQLGSSWQIELWTVGASASAAAEIRDVLALKQAIEALVRLGEVGHPVGANLALARGEYHRERGELAASERCLEAALAQLPPGEGILRAEALPALAETHLAAGRYREAAEVAKRAIEHSLEPERFGVGSILLRAERVLARAEAALGDLPGARARMQRAAEAAKSIGNPATSGMIHEVAAELARQARDSAAFHHHVERAREYFAATGNPVLLARWNQLAERGSQELEAEPLVDRVRACSTTRTAPPVAPELEAATEDGQGVPPNG